MGEKQSEVGSTEELGAPGRPEPEWSEIILWIIGIQVFPLALLGAAPYFWFKFGSRRSTWFFTVWAVWLCVVAWAALSQANLEVQQLLKDDEMRKRQEQALELIRKASDDEIAIPKGQEVSPEEWNNGDFRGTSQ